MTLSPFKQLALRLDELPDGYPPSPHGYEIQILEALFSPDEAALGAQLRLTLESAHQIAERLGRDYGETRALLKGMASKGLIEAGPMEGGLGYGLMPFVVGIYEMRLGRIDARLAALFEAYYKEAFANELRVAPQVHRVIPVGESVRVDLAIAPYESAASLVDRAQAWGVIDCICRVQKAQVGEPCEHPVDVCLMLSRRPNAYEGHPVIRSLSRDGAHATLKRAADAGLVHSVSNNQEGVTYICNCCTCSCGILRGLKEMGFANVVARSAFVNTVEAEICNGCETCLEYCQFNALELGDDLVMQVHPVKCVGCGVCVPHCETGALVLARRPDSEIQPIPLTHDAWLAARAQAKGMDLGRVL